jgi:D-serine deaminase-like pyridoxal phosphate-dependent protein
VKDIQIRDLAGTERRSPLDLNELLSQPVDWRFRAFPAGRGGVKLGEVGARGWTLFGDEMLFPIMVLKESALNHNLTAMSRWCAREEVSLAPHGKTTMAPQLFARQLEAGAWAMTAASVGHARMYRAFGVPRILIANEVVRPAELGWIAAELEADPACEIYCYADSVEGVELLGRTFEGRSRTLPVLVELGASGGRTGARTLDEAERVASTISRRRELTLAGVGGYEGNLAGDRAAASLATVDAFCDRMVDLYRRLESASAFAGQPIVTAGGSAFPDRVVARLAPVRPRARVVIRPGCYVTHDDGFYDAISPFSRDGIVELRPALELWGSVLSRPEPSLAIVGFGKRDAPFDIGLPLPHRVWSPSEGLRDARGLRVAKLNDQHAYLEVAPGERIMVGDLVGCGISHPCLAFDRWSLLALVDDAYAITGAVRTFF